MRNRSVLVRTTESLYVVRALGSGRFGDSLQGRGGGVWLFVFFFPISNAGEEWDWGFRGDSEKERRSRFHQMGQGRSNLRHGDQTAFGSGGTDLVLSKTPSLVLHCCHCHLEIIRSRALNFHLALSPENEVQPVLRKYKGEGWKGLSGPWAACPLAITFGPRAIPESTLLSPFRWKEDSVCARCL